MRSNLTFNFNFKYNKQKISEVYLNTALEVRITEFCYIVFLSLEKFSFLFYFLSHNLPHCYYLANPHNRILFNYELFWYC